MTIRIITRREIIKSVPSRFMSQYSRYSDDKPLPWTAGVESKREMFERLRALDTDTCTAEDVGAIIGNDSWTSLDCSECGQSCDAVVRIGDEPDYDARWVDVCSDCLGKASEILARALPSDRRE